jgi:CHAT domain-containing protein
MPNDKKIALTVTGRRIDAPALPRVLASAMRSGEAGLADPFLPRGYVRALEGFDLSATARSTPEGSAAHVIARQPGQVVALELADGITVFTSPESLEETLARVAPEGVDQEGLDLDALRTRAEATRGGEAASNLISRVTLLDVGAISDPIIDAARRKLLEWMGARGGEALAGQVELGVSWLGTKALMWAIESRLGREPGLYRWVGARGEPTDLLSVGDERLAREAQQGPLLVFIHGTASSTVGSYADLQAASREYWERFEDRFGERIYAFEHRTLSESPIQNALQLARALPARARLNLVTHSRGGLIGDLLCLDRLDAADAALVDRYAVDEASLGETEGEERARLRRELEGAYGEQRALLRELAALLRERQFIVERYVRVACPANGTRLASGNFDVFLSGLLTLIGLVPALAGSLLYSAFKRVVLEIARNRTRPGLVPGIEAMLPESPMGRLLGQATPQAATAMAVIAGDIEGGGLLKRLGVFFTDKVFFDDHDNDLVVDTGSMYAGVAGRARNARALFDQGPDVSHFRYFSNGDTRGALRRWLLDSNVEAIDVFAALPALGTEASLQEERRRLEALRLTRGGDAAQLPVVVVLPGIMGSHLWKNRRDRVWFDFDDLMTGGLDKIRYGEDGVEAEKLFDLFYGDLCEHLAATHRVERFAYDWRQPLNVLADALAGRLRELLAQSAGPQRPVRLLAHSMGGLVVRALVHEHRALWNEVMAREGARFVMLGTPNQGSFLMVETLIGKSDTARKLARIDLKNDLQHVLDIIGGFPGALQLLPRPGFKEGAVAANPHASYYDAAVWPALKAQMRDFWFGDGVAATPGASVLEKGSWLWRRDDGAPALPAEHAAKVWYVHGCAANTPCGIVRSGGRWKMLGTPRGDGSVTWESGAIGGIGRRLYMPAEHGALADTEAYFASLEALLSRGDPGELLTAPPAVRGAQAAAAVAYDAGPPAFPTPLELASSLAGRRPRARARARAQPTLAVSVRAADLREVAMPIMVGHYEQDPISGAEALIDRDVVGDGLSMRYDLGMYAGPLGTATVVLPARNVLERGRGSRRGAVVAGLGRYDGSLSVGSLTEAVRTAVLRYLLQIVDAAGGDAGIAEGGGVSLATLLIGYNSSANLSIGDSVGAIVRGVLEANRKFREVQAGRRADEGGGDTLHVAELELVELYMDTAISAAYALKRVGQTLNDDPNLRCRVLPGEHLLEGSGMRQRLEDSRSAAYWSRIVVTDADRREDECPPECYADRCPPECYEQPCEPGCGGKAGGKAGGGEGGQAAQAAQACAEALTSVPDRRMPAGLRRRLALAQRLRFLYLGQRARAETIVQQRQPGLIEQLVAQQLHVRRFMPDFSRTLFQLMVPHDFKDAARQLDRVVMVLDGYTANLPWELMLADDEPLVVKAPLVRQLSSTRFRARVRQTAERRAYVIGNPSTVGFAAAYPGSSGELDALPAAENEANTVAEVLARHRYEVVGAIGQDQMAIDVINRLYQHPYRVLHIAAHGIFDAQHADGNPRSGVVLSCGLLITAAEIGAMESVPELVFLNCCHLGKVDRAPAAFNRLAYSVARELIEMGVRAVVVAGWAVDDQPAQLFAETFYGALLGERQFFGDAVFQARRAVWQRFRESITWGAYQAYGDPGWRIEPRRDDYGDGAPAPRWSFVSPEEVIAKLDQIRFELAGSDHAPSAAEARNCARDIDALIEAVPREWLERPDLRMTLGRAWGDLGASGFTRAIDWLQKAIAGQDRRAPAAISAIEQLANLEARKGEADDDPARILRAIGRLNELLRVVAAAPEVPAADQVGNSERTGLLGSAWKRLAAVFARRGIAGDGDGPAALRRQMIEALEQSAQWYAAAIPGLKVSELARGTLRAKAVERIEPYSVLNWVFLETVLEGERTPAVELIELARGAAQVANARFAGEPDFWNAIMVPDAQLAEALLEGALDGDGRDARIDRLFESYAAAMAGIQVKPKDLDSTVQQICLVALFSAATGRRSRADALRRLADRLVPNCCSRTFRGVLPDEPPGDPDASPPAEPPGTTGAGRRAPREAATGSAGRRAGAGGSGTAGRKPSTRTRGRKGSEK